MNCKVAWSIKKVVSKCFYMVNLIIKSFLLLIEWKIVKTITNKWFSYLKHDVVTVVKLLGN